MRARARWSRVGCTLGVAGVLLALSGAAYAQPTQAVTAPAVEVVGTSPIPGIGALLDQIPHNVQTVTGREIERQHALGTAQALEQGLGSVNLNAGQGNPFQPALNYRGFAASPLLGAPQGLSVYVDGVRVNEAFGDVVNWDLIPAPAIARIDAVPGSNPAFGLNTLGGALSITTRTGRGSPGRVAELSSGSFGRTTARVASGEHDAGGDFFIGANLQDDAGWRTHSASRVRQVYAEAGRRLGDGSLQLDFIAADNLLHGTQALPRSLANDPRQAYTWPDYTANRLAFLVLRGRDAVGENWEVSGNVYERDLHSDAFDSNVSDGYDPARPLGPGNSPGENDLAYTASHGFGGTVQLTDFADAWQRPNQLTLGLSADLARTRYRQSAQAAQFVGDREAVGIAPFAEQVDLDARNRYDGVYASDTLSFAPRWDLTVSARYNEARVALHDRRGSALTGTHAYARIDPAIGVAFHPQRGFTAYVSYGEGTRVPTPVELTCADPAAPCKLPNQFLADPPLKQVVAKTVTVGGRGALATGLHWGAAVFRTDVVDDIEFVSSGAASTSAGYFRNVPRTRREGIELDANGRWRRLRWRVGYAYLQAIYGAGFVERSPSNSSADASGDIRVRPGDRIPGIPRHLLKLRLDYAATARLSLRANVDAASEQYAYGNENNLDPGGVVSGYALFGFRVGYRLTRKITLFGEVDNLFDRRYATFGALGQNAFTGPEGSFGGAARPETFVSPGAPRGAWVGIRIVS